MATHNFHSAYGKFPYGMLRNQPPEFPHPEEPISGQYRRYGLMHQLLPYVEQGVLWDRWDQLDFNANRLAPGGTVEWDGDHFFKQVVMTMVCPSNPGGLLNEAADPNDSGRYFRSHYYGAAGTRGYPRRSASRPSLYNPFYPDTPNPTPSNSYTALADGIFTQNRQYRIGDAIDGTSNTLLLGERRFEDRVFDSDTGDRIRDWGWVWFGAQGDCFLGTSAPINFQLPENFPTLDAGTQQLLFDDRINAYGSMHPGGAQVALVDGSVRFLSETISPITFRALGTRDGSEVVSDF